MTWSVCGCNPQRQKLARTHTLLLTKNKQRNICWLICTHKCDAMFILCRWYWSTFHLWVTRSWPVHLRPVVSWWMAGQWNPPTPSLLDRPGRWSSIDMRPRSDRGSRTSLALATSQWPCKHWHRHIPSPSQRYLVYDAMRSCNKVAQSGYVGAKSEWNFECCGYLCAVDSTIHSV